LPTTIGAEPSALSGENFRRISISSGASKRWRARNGHARPARLAWLLAKGDEHRPDTGTKHRKYVEENVGALNVTLSGAELAQIEDVGSAAGARYAEGGMRTVNG